MTASGSFTTTTTRAPGTSSTFEVMPSPRSETFVVNPVLATGSCDVLGVDPGRAEGITGFKLVCDRTEAYRRQANAHAWSSAIVSAASLAISFSSPACKLFELKPLRNPMQHDLVTEPIDHVDGWVAPPTRPGLGIEVLDEVVDRYRSDRVLAGA